VNREGVFEVPEATLRELVQSLRGG
jgi:hypothetical protein